MDQAMKERTPAPPALHIDIRQLSDGMAARGSQWSHESEDLDLTLLSWRGQQAIAPHVNDDVDVLLIGIAGSGTVTVNGEAFQLSPGQAILILKGAERSMQCVDAQWSYLSVHRRRRGLWPTVGRVPLA